jgi:hypothetical protein
MCNELFCKLVNPGVLFFQFCDIKNLVNLCIMIAWKMNFFIGFVFEFHFVTCEIMLWNMFIV